MNSQETLSAPFPAYTRRKGLACSLSSHPQKLLSPLHAVCEGKKEMLMGKTQAGGRVGTPGRVREQESPDCHGL